MKEKAFSQMNMENIVKICRLMYELASYFCMFPTLNKSINDNNDNNVTKQKL